MHEKPDQPWSFPVEILLMTGVIGMTCLAFGVVLPIAGAAWLPLGATLLVTYYGLAWKRARLSVRRAVTAAPGYRRRRPSRRTQPSRAARGARSHVAA